MLIKGLNVAKQSIRLDVLTGKMLQMALPFLNLKILSLQNAMISGITYLHFQLGYSSKNYHFSIIFTYPYRENFTGT